jgi:protein-disulfide isomerase
MWIRWGLIIIVCSTPAFASDNGCRSLSDQQNSQITQYLAHRIESQSGGVPSILSATLVPDTCYRKLVIQVTGTSNPMTLYLSPDQRFLTSTLYDLARDPDEEAAQVAANVQQLLMRDESPRTSGRDARITLVEFGDLQCPYSRRFADWYRSLPAELLSETDLVFKHLPLPMHSWAQQAAQYAACANRQSATAFWELANYFLAHQEEITPANITAKASEVLSHIPNVNAQDFASCATTNVGSDVVARDTAVAKELAVNRTPTLFIDGRQLPPLHSGEDLRLALERELRDRSAQVTGGGNEQDRGRNYGQANQNNAAVAHDAHRCISGGRSRVAHSSRQ